MTTLEDLRALSEGATAGDWQAYKPDSHPWIGIRTQYRDGEGRRHTAWPAECACGGQDNTANAALIATSVNIIRKLVAPETVEAMARASRDARHALYREKDEADFNAVEIAAMSAALRVLIEGQS